VLIPSSTTLTFDRQPVLLCSYAYNVLVHIAVLVYISGNPYSLTTVMQNFISA